MRFKQNIIFILVTLLLSTTALSTLHTQDKHVHDASCSVYVLEHQLLGADVPTAFVLLVLFIAFIFTLLTPLTVPTQTLNPKQSRAPPKPFL